MYSVHTVTRQTDSATTSSLIRFSDRTVTTDTLQYTQLRQTLLPNLTGRYNKRKVETVRRKIDNEDEETRSNSQLTTHQEPVRFCSLPSFSRRSLPPPTNGNELGFIE